MSRKDRYRTMRLEGKVALITGAARGMGAVEARLFTEEGAKVCISDVLEEQGRQVAADITESGGDAFFTKLDITSEDDWARVVDDVVSRFGKLDILINNAAMNHVGTVEETTADEWDRVMEVNAKGAFLGTKAVIPAMRRAGGGSIVNISSGAGLVGTWGSTAYNASKAAVHMLARCTAIQYAQDGIRANTIHPGATNTSMLAESSAALGDSDVFIRPLGRMADPKEIAYGVLYLASDESSFTTGAHLSIDGGMLAGIARRPDAAATGPSSPGSART
jgi:NAD(P)-dependent dehydrogenase (short-subunit alcohol dehydrogenase family)